MLRSSQSGRWDEVAFGLCRYCIPIELLATRAAEAPALPAPSGP
jgi:hypothetical protein